MKKLFATDLESVLQKAKAELATAVDRAQRLKREFDHEFVGLHASGNEVAIQRRRKQIAEAEAVVAELAEAAERVSRELVAVKAREAAAEVEVRWQIADDMRHEFEVAAEQAQAALVAAGAALKHFDTAGEALRTALSQPGMQSPRDENSTLWNRSMIGRRAEFQLIAASDGVIRTGVPVTVWQCQQMPDFAAAARDSASRAFSMRPRGTDPSPSEAA